MAETQHYDTKQNKFYTMTELRDNSTTKYTQVLSVDIARLPMAET